MTDTYIREELINDPMSIEPEDSPDVLVVEKAPGRLADAKPEVLKYYLSVYRHYANEAFRAERELLTFRYKLETIMEKPLTSERREELAHEGVQLSEYFPAGEFMKADDRFLRLVFGENKYTGQSPDHWKFHSEAEDLLAETDRTLEAAVEVRQTLTEGGRIISNVLEGLGYGVEKYRLFQAFLRDSMMQSTGESCKSPAELRLEALKKAAGNISIEQPEDIFDEDIGELEDGEIRLFPDGTAFLI